MRTETDIENGPFSRGSAVLTLLCVGHGYRKVIPDVDLVTISSTRFRYSRTDGSIHSLFWVLVKAHTKDLLQTQSAFIYINSWWENCPIPPLQHMHTYITTELLSLWLHFDIFVSFLLLSLSLAGSFASTLSVKPHQDTAQLSREIEHGCSDLVSFMKTRSAWFQVWLLRLYFWHYRKPVTAVIYHQWVKLNALQFYRVYVI